MPGSCDVIVFFANPSWSLGLRQRLRHVRHVVAYGFESWQGEAVVNSERRQLLLESPKPTEEVDITEILTATVETHRPKLLVGAGLFAKGVHQTDDNAMITELPCPTESSVPLESWVAKYCAACQQVESPAILAAVPESGDQTSTIQSMQKQPTLAAKAGAALRSIFHDPSEVPKLWRYQQAVWENQERLAEVVLSVVSERLGSTL